MINTHSIPTFELSSQGRRGCTLMFFPQLTTISDKTFTFRKTDGIMIKLYQEGESSTEHTCLFHVEALYEMKNYIMEKLRLEFKSNMKIPEVTKLDSEAQEFIDKSSITVLHSMLNTIQDAVYLGLIDQDNNVADLLNELPPEDAW